MFESTMGDSPLSHGAMLITTYYTADIAITITTIIIASTFHWHMIFGY